MSVSPTMHRRTPVAAGGLRPIFSADPTVHLAHRVYAQFSHLRRLHERSSRTRVKTNAGPAPETAAGAPLCRQKRASGARCGAASDRGVASSQRRPRAGCCPPEAATRSQRPPVPAPPLKRPRLRIAQAPAVLMQTRVSAPLRVRLASGELRAPGGSPGPGRAWPGLSGSSREPPGCGEHPDGCFAQGAVARPGWNALLVLGESTSKANCWQPAFEQATVSALCADAPLRA